MLSDPLSVTYNGSAKSLPRTSMGTNGTVYRTADGDYEVSISKSSKREGSTRVEIKLSKQIPDPTPADVFDDYRPITNAFGLVMEFDTVTRAESSVDIPLLRSAILALVDSTLQSRLIQGEM